MVPEMPPPPPGPKYEASLPSGRLNSGEAVRDQKDRELELPSADDPWHKMPAHSRHRSGIVNLMICSIGRNGSAIMYINISALPWR
jgi:hypothetical protein